MTEVSTEGLRLVVVRDGHLRHSVDSVSLNFSEGRVLNWHVHNSMASVRVSLVSVSFATTMAMSMTSVLWIHRVPDVIRWSVLVRLTNAELLELIPAVTSASFDTLQVVREMSDLVILII